MLPEESDQLWLHCHSAISPLGHIARSPTAHSDEFVYSRQVVQPGNQFNSGKSADGAQQFTWTSSTQQLALTTSAKIRSSSLRDQFGSYKSANGDQQLALMTSAKIRSCGLRDQFGSYKSVDGDQQLALTTSAKIRSCSLRDQFGSYKSADGDQQLALTTSAKNRSCSLGISLTQANRPTEPISSHGRALLSNSL